MTQTAAPARPESDRNRTDTEPGPSSRGAGRLRPQRARRLGVHVASVAALLLLWWLVTRAGLVRPLYLPSPGAVWDAFVRANSDHPIATGSDRIVRGEQNYYLWEHLVASLQRIAIGVGAAVAVGIPLGLLMGTTWLGTLLEPYLNFLRSLPPLAYIGLLIVWFGIGDTSKIWLLFLAAFPPIAMSTISGVRGVHEDQVNAVLSLGAIRRQVLTAVVLPADAAGDPHGHPRGHRLRLDHGRRRGDRQRHPRHRGPRLPGRRAAPERAGHRLHRRDRPRRDPPRPRPQEPREGPRPLAGQGIAAPLRRPQIRRNDPVKARPTRTAAALAAVTLSLSLAGCVESGRSSTTSAPDTDCPWRPTSR